MVQGEVLALLVIAAVAPLVVVFVESRDVAFLCRQLRKRPSKTTAGAGRSPLPAPAVPTAHHDVEVARAADQ